MKLVNLALLLRKTHSLLSNCTKEVFKLTKSSCSNFCLYNQLEVGNRCQINLCTVRHWYRLVATGVEVSLEVETFWKLFPKAITSLLHFSGLPWTFSPDIDLEVETWWWEVGRPMFSIWKSGSRSAEHKLASFGRFCPKTTPKNGDVGSPHQKINVRPLPDPFTIQFFYPRIHTLMKTSHTTLVLSSRL